MEYKEVTYTDAFQQGMLLGIEYANTLLREVMEKRGKYLDEKEQNGVLFGLLSDYTNDDKMCFIDVLYEAGAKALHRNIDFDKLYSVECKMQTENESKGVEF